MLIRGWLSSLLVLAAPSMGQQAVVVPVGASLDSTEGSYWISSFGSYQQGRVQWVEGELRGRARTLVGFDCRPDRSRGQASLARRFPSCVIQLGQADRAALVSTFTQNYRGSATEVFRGALVLPALVGTGPQPAAWSLQLGFRSPFVDPGTLDLLIDTTFVGGVRSDSKPWQSSPAVDYLLDAPSTLDSVAGPMTTHGVAGACIDSGARVGASAWLWTSSYHPTMPLPPLRNTITIDYGGSGFGAGSAVVFALGGLGSPAGVPLPGLRCNRLHVDSAGPALFRMERANGAGAVPTKGVAGRPFPYRSDWVGVALWCQAAWCDTVTDQLKLSNGAENEIQAHRARPRIQRTTIYAPLSATAATGILSDSPFLCPVIRYRF